MELREIESRQKEYEDKCRKETVYQRIERLKREDAEFHKTAFESLAINDMALLSNQLKEWELSKEQNGGSYQAKRQLIRPHPEHEKERERAAYDIIA